jgi:hypothetical protein
MFLSQSEFRDLGIKSTEEKRGAEKGRKTRRWR